MNEFRSPEPEMPGYETEMQEDASQPPVPRLLVLLLVAACGITVLLLPLSSVLYTALAWRMAMNLMMGLLLGTALAVPVMWLLVMRALPDAIRWRMRTYRRILNAGYVLTLVCFTSPFMMLLFGPPSGAVGDAMVMLSTAGFCVYIVTCLTQLIACIVLICVFPGSLSGYALGTHVALCAALVLEFIVFMSVAVAV